MRNFFSNLGYRMQQWMNGRYGNDEFNRFLSIFAFVFLLASCFSRFWSPLVWFYIPGVLILIYTVFRSFSKNTYARSKERGFYLKVTGKIAGFFRLNKRKWSERDTSVFFKCPNCKATIRVPKGKGKIQITCPKCRNQFIKKT